MTRRSARQDGKDNDSHPQQPTTKRIRLTAGGKSLTTATTQDAMDIDYNTSTPERVASPTNINIPSSTTRIVIKPLTSSSPNTSFAPDSLASLPISPYPGSNAPQALNIAIAPKPFKSNPKYQTPKRFKTVKQVVTAGKALNLPMDVPTYWSIDAPPSLRPSKKYCDITGLEAPYTDPKWAIRYHDADTYKFLRNLTPHDVQSYLVMRKATVDLR